VPAGSGVPGRFAVIWHSQWRRPGAHRGHINARSARKHRELLRSHPQVNRQARDIGHGQRDQCTRPGLQADLSEIYELPTNYCRKQTVTKWIQSAASLAPILVP